jgi:hypothetical protein
MSALRACGEGFCDVFAAAVPLAVVVVAVVVAEVVVVVFAGAGGAVWCDLWCCLDAFFDATDTVALATVAVVDELGAVAAALDAPDDVLFELPPQAVSPIPAASNMSVRIFRFAQP